MPTQNYRKPCISFLLLIILGTGLCARSSAQTSAQSAPSSPCGAKVVQLLTASSYQFKTHSSEVWSITFSRESLKDFRVVIATNKELVVMFVIVAKKAQMDITSEFMHTLLRFNHQFDQVKIGLDDDGDLFVRTDSTCRLLDVAELKANIEQVASSANEVHQSVKGSISSGK